MTTSLVLDALNHAIWARSREGTTDLTGLVHHNDAGSQYTSLAFTDRLALAGIAPSVGSVGDALDNALAESIMGLYKTELIHHHGPWKGLQDIEIATLEYIDWFNHRRLHRSCGDITPTELETAYYSKHIPPIKVGSTQH